MSRIRGSGTKPELRVRSLLHSMGYRFRLHRKDLPGTPDIVLPRHRTVIFVHGCYWHRHRGCKYAYTPKSRVTFWQAKFDENVARDHRTQRELRKARWRVIVVWGCETNDLAELAHRLSEELTNADIEAI
jgi:DNA mismatch endonuclease (patch repair protein)